MTIWEFSAELTKRLFTWAIASIATGAALSFNPNRQQQGVGVQFVGWGVVNLLIAFLGGHSTQRRAQQPNAHEPVTLATESRNLRRLLWINTGLDVGYILGGLVLARTKGRSDARWRGQGYGIVAQGGFLFFFDLFHALLVGKQDVQLFSKS